MQVDPATVAAVATNDYTGTVIGLIGAVLLSLISTGAMLWKTTRDQKHQLAMLEAQSRIASAERREQAALVQATQEVSAASIRERLAVTGQTTAATVVQSAHDVREDTRLIAQLQTIELKTAIEEAKELMIARAERAYKESNDVNTKLRLLHEANQKTVDVLERLVRSIDNPPVNVKREEVGR